MEYIKAYGGNDSYIFISYAHKDTESVLPIIKNLINSGYRTWYDEGIEPGKDWDNYIAEHVIGCSYFIAFVSPSYLASSNCMDELNFARDENKKLLIVYLSPVELPAGMRMRLNRLQAINKYTFENEENFFEKLFSADEINEMRDSVSEEPSTEPTPSPAKSESKTIETDDYKYTGEVLNGKPDGHGKCYYKATGEEWECEWKNGVKCGEIATIRYYSGVRMGSVYQGEFSKDMPNGFGKLTYPDGAYWEGEWKDKYCCNGKGTIRYSDGNVYCGEVRNGALNGIGKMTWANGYEWEGEFSDNYPLNGNGTTYFSQHENRYIGTLKNGKRNGQGTMYWATLNKKTGKYVVTGHWSISGEWKDNQIWNGEGNPGPEELWAKFCNGVRLQTKQTVNDKPNNNDDDFYRTINQITKGK